MSLALIDYGAGNLHSVHNAVIAAGARDVKVTSDPKDVLNADRIVLPGVGAFGACAEGLRALPDMIEALEQRILTDAMPFLGICVGMQLLADQGCEHGVHQGLGWIGGTVEIVEPSNSVKVPHMGWNDVVVSDNVPLLENGEAYFLHSYHFVPIDRSDIAAMTDHGGNLVAAVARDNILGVQFHPEKSQSYGLNLLARFLEWQP